MTHMEGRKWPWPTINDRGDVDLTTSHTWTAEERAAYALDEDAAWSWEGAPIGGAGIFVEESEDL